jgi:hypothetical protein
MFNNIFLQKAISVCLLHPIPPCHLRLRSPAESQILKYHATDSLCQVIHTQILHHYVLIHQGGRSAVTSFSPPFSPKQTKPPDLKTTTSQKLFFASTSELAFQSNLHKFRCLHKAARARKRADFVSNERTNERTFHRSFNLHIPSEHHTTAETEIVRPVA